MSLQTPYPAPTVTDSRLRPTPPPREGKRPDRRPPTGGREVHTTPQRTPELVLRVERWLDRPTLPPRLPAKIAPANGQLKSVTVILAGELELRGGSYAFAARQTPRNVILVVDRLRLTGEVSFDLSGRALDVRRRVGMDTLDRSGGDLVILARDVEVEPGGRLVLRSAGGRGYERVRSSDSQGGGAKRPNLLKSPRYSGGHGGQLMVSARRFHAGGRVFDADGLPPEIASAFVLDAPRGGAGPGLLQGEDGERWLSSSPEQVVVELESRDLRRFGYGVGQPAVSRWARKGTSEWLVAILEDAVSRLRVASLGGDRREALRALSRAVGLVRDGAPLDDGDRALHGALLEDLTTLADRFSNALTTDTLIVQTPSGAPRRLDLFTAGRELSTRLAPSDALVRPRRAGEREVLGLLALDPEDPGLLRLELEAQLTLDPWLEARAADALAGRGEKVAGIFAGWNLAARPLVGDGILSSRVEVGPSGVVRAVLDLEADRAGLVLARLSSSAGLPLVFDWSYPADPQLRGTWQGPALTLVRRMGRSVEIDSEGRLWNRGGEEVVVSYVELLGDTFSPLYPAITLAPGATASLPGDLATSAVSVPTEALSYPTDAAQPGRLFQSARTGDLVEKVTVTNLLAHDPVLGGLLHVEVELTHRRGSAETSVGPYRLAPAGAEGDRVDVTLLTLESGPREVQVQGTAHYEGGSRESFDFTSSDLVVKLTADRLGAGVR